MPDTIDIANLIAKSGRWSDARVRTVSTWWHSFNRTPCPLYALGSSGYIGAETTPYIRNLVFEVIASVKAGSNADWSWDDVSDLINILTYVEREGERDAVDGWHLLWDDAYENARMDSGEGEI